MTETVKTKHIALLYSDRKKAEIFFNKILGIELSKSFTLSKELSKEIFNIDEKVTVDVYSNSDNYFEVFITSKKTNYSYEHTCIEVNNKDDFFNRCRTYKIEPIFVKKGEKYLMFIRDFSGNLFEIKEKN